MSETSNKQSTKYSVKDRYIVDPKLPRECTDGSEKKTLDAITDIKLKAVVYVVPNPSGLNNATSP